MEWAQHYYTLQSETFARPVVTDQHRAIAARLRALGGLESEPPVAVLELGAGNGGVAAALAEHGHDVWAVEFNAADAEHARTLAAAATPGTVHVVEADFFTVRLERRFDFAFIWDGFGIGRDEDQRRLLRRFASDWLTPDGRAFIDVYSPWNWLRRDGETSVYTARDGRSWERRIEFDALDSRFVDHWEPLPERDEHRTQTLRCYTVPEFDLLLEGTGLVAEAYLDVDGAAPTSARLAETTGYYVLARRG